MLVAAMTAGRSQQRRLLLLRHAKSAWPDDVADHERPLTGRGRRDAPAAGRWLHEHGSVPDLVLCSTARRAQQTWQLAQDSLCVTPQTIYDQRVYDARSADLLALARQTPAEITCLLIVGHNPAMQALTLDLADARDGAAPAASTQAGALGQVRAKFPTAAIAVVSFTGSWPDLRPGHAQLEDFART